MSFFETMASSALTSSCPDTLSSATVWMLSYKSLWRKTIVSKSFFSIFNNSQLLLAMTVAFRG